MKHLMEDKELAVLRYLEGDLGPEEEQAFKEALATDPEVDKLLEEYRQQERLLEAWHGEYAAQGDRIRRPDLSTVPSVTQRARAGLTARSIGLIAAAAAIALVAVAGVVLYQPDLSRVQTGEVVMIEGRPRAFVSGQAERVVRNARLHGAQERLRTFTGDYLDVELARGLGSFEVRENSTVSLARSGDTTRVGLERGEVLVQLEDSNVPGADAEVQVRTPDLRVTTTDGTFSVVMGLRGSEVGVVRGEVEVRSRNVRRRLAAGETYSSIDADPIPVAQRISWSRHSRRLVAELPASARVEQYTPLEEPAATPGDVASGPGEVPPVDASVAEAAPAREPDVTAATEIPAVATASAPATATNLSAGHAPTTDYLPLSTISFIEIPSVPRLLESSGKDNLADALLGDDIRNFAVNSVTNLDPNSMDEIAENLDRFFTNEDISTVAASLRGSATVGISNNGLVLVAQVTDDFLAVSELINSRLDGWYQSDEFTEKGPRAQVTLDRMLVFVANRELLGEADMPNGPWERTGYAASPFVEDVYTQTPGSYFTAALDARQMLANLPDESFDRALDRVGIGNLRSIVAATSFADQAENRGMRMTFDGERRGVASWLDRPGPLSGFKLFSPDAHLIAAARVRRPGDILRDMVGWHGDEQESEISQDPVFDAFRRMTDSLGNEVVVGLDNPVLPVPNVKLAFEAVDPLAFNQAALDFIYGLADLHPLKPQPEIVDEMYRNHVIVEVRSFVELPFTFSYALVDDFVVFGPGRDFLRMTIDVYLADQTLDRERAFVEALPALSGSHVSGLVYVGPGQSLGAAAPVLEEVFRARNIPIDPALLGARPGNNASVYYAIAGESHVDFYIEGIKGGFAMAGMIPAVADWISSNGR